MMGGENEKILYPREFALRMGVSVNDGRQVEFVSGDNASMLGMDWSNCNSKLSLRMSSLSYLSYPETIRS